MLKMLEYGDTERLAQPKTHPNLSFRSIEWKVIERSIPTPIIGREYWSPWSVIIER